MNQLKKYPFLTLTIVALLCGIIWRLEIEYSGWGGLTWLSYFHFAIPIGFFLFTFWANLLIEIDLQKRIWLNVISLIYGIALYILLNISLTFTFVSGPSGLALIVNTPGWLLKTLSYSILFLVPFMSVGTFIILRSFKLKVKARFLVLSLISIVLSVPFSKLFLELVNHKGSHDYIHTIKSGFIIPFLVFSIGLLIAGAEKSRRTTEAMH